MTTGRIRGFIDYRFYVDGYDISGYSRDIGEFGISHDDAVDSSVTKAIKGHWIGQATVTPGVINAVLDDTAGGLHASLRTSTDRDLMVAIGKLAAPVDGDIAFCGQFPQNSYRGGGDATGLVAATLSLGEGQHGASTLGYACPFGRLLLAHAAKTAANSAVGFDNYSGAATALGGWMMYQISAAAGTGDITATLKVQHAATNLDGSFADLLSSGVLNLGSGGTFGGPYSGVVALGHTADVYRYTRWQIALGTATSVTAAIAFMRAYVVQ